MTVECDPETKQTPRTVTDRLNKRSERLRKGKVSVKCRVCGDIVRPSIAANSFAAELRGHFWERHPELMEGVSK